MNDNDIERFTEAQNNSCNGYKQALAEIRSGRKCSHWIWYIFPQLRGLGHSHYAHFYGLSGRAEAVRYLEHPLLGTRLREISHTLLQHRDKNATTILGDIDALKVCSSMTLFDTISPGNVFGEILTTLYANKRCELTLHRLADNL